MLHKLLIGSYTETVQDTSIHFYQYDDAEETITPLFSDGNSRSASFLNLTGDRLLAVNELKGQGYLDLYAVQEQSLKLLDRLAVEGSDLCHIHHWKESNIYSAADYTSGDFVIFSVEGEKLRMIQQVRHHGVGFDSDGRQEGPHVHATILSPDGQVLYVADLGLDTVFAYQRNEDGTVSEMPDACHLKFPGGQGPRHMAFSPDGAYFFTITEMGGWIAIFQNHADHRMEFIRLISALPEGFRGENLSADLHVSGDGRFVYASNRGANTIAAFQFDAENETLLPVGQYDVHGDGPRNFCLSEDETRLFAVNQYSGNLTIFKRDPKNGTLKYLSSHTICHAPVYVQEVL